MKISFRGEDEAKLVEQFATMLFNKLFDKKEAIEAELRRRSGDGRGVLLSLFDHPNMQVRGNAAKATLALASRLSAG